MSIIRLVEDEACQNYSKISDYRVDLCISLDEIHDLAPYMACLTLNRQQSLMVGR